MVAIRRRIRTTTVMSSLSRCVGLCLRWLSTAGAQSRQVTLLEVLFIEYCEATHSFPSVVTQSSLSTKSLLPPCIFVRRDLVCCIRK
ncbi:hypothetical protein AHF37_07051 [Paragonimus kellicotti]|nr:hypothetical protein AHF37_07051 [Paragonimus kellicotti]